jgi:hypothetical protein
MSQIHLGRSNVADSSGPQQDNPDRPKRERFMCGKALFARTACATFQPQAIRGAPAAGDRRASAGTLSPRITHHAAGLP